jgi:drug/metabolite transporter (DMT)-like permease
MSPRDWTMLFTLGLLWGGSFFFSAIAVTEIPPLVLVLFRVVLAAASRCISIWPFAAPPSARLPLAGSFLVLGLINNVIPFSLMFLGQTEIGAGLAAVLNATTPVLDRDPRQRADRGREIHPAKLIGILLGILGTAVMIGPGLLTGSADRSGPSSA